MDALRTLLASPGWGLLAEVIDQQVATRTDSIILKPLQGTDEALGQEFSKGEIAGLRLLRHLPDALVKMYEEELKGDGTSADE